MMLIMTKTSFLTLISQLNHSSLWKFAFSIILSVFCFFISSEGNLDKLGSVFIDLYSESDVTELYICSLHRKEYIIQERDRKVMQGLHYFIKLLLLLW